MKKQEFFQIFITYLHIVPFRADHKENTQDLGND